MSEKLFKLKPLGRADILLDEYIDDKKRATKEFLQYEKALAKYRNFKLLQIIIKILLYAGVITSVAASFGIEEIKIITQIASYIGVSVLLISYAAVNYATMIYREEYHIKREILVSTLDST